LRVKLFGVLRDCVGNTAVSLPVREGETVRAVLQQLTERYPSLRRRIFAPDGELQLFLLISVRGVDIRHCGGLAATVSAGDELLIFPPSAGG